MALSKTPLTMPALQKKESINKHTIAKMTNTRLIMGRYALSDSPKGNSTLHFSRPNGIRGYNFKWKDGLVPICLSVSLGLRDTDTPTARNKLSDFSGFLSTPPLHLKLLCRRDSAHVNSRELGIVSGGWHCNIRAERPLIVILIVARVLAKSRRVSG